MWSLQSYWLISWGTDCLLTILTRHPPPLPTEMDQSFILFFPFPCAGILLPHEHLYPFVKKHGLIFSLLARMYCTTAWVSFYQSIQLHVASADLSLCPPPVHRYITWDCSPVQSCAWARAHTAQQAEENQRCHALLHFFSTVHSTSGSDAIVPFSLKRMPSDHWYKWSQSLRAICQRRSRFPWWQQRCLPSTGHHHIG